MSLALIHFQPLENYPPVMNCIRDLEYKNVREFSIYTTHSQNNWFSSCNPIYRLGNYSTSKWSRYFTYLFFNLTSFFFLCLYRPKKVLYYETYSVWPVYWYKKLFSKVQIYIHFHEYVSEKEKKESSSYFKFLLRIEKYLLLKASWISHTNEDRMILFLHDYPYVKNEQCNILPNYPPADWSVRAQQIRAIRTISITKRMVYVGALGLDTTYIQEIAAWIVEQKGTFILDIYSSNMDKSVLNFLHNLNSNYISIHKAITYFDLPELLATYDIGLVLYLSLIHI
jgi:hypothetical protein